MHAYVENIVVNQKKHDFLQEILHFKRKKTLVIVTMFIHIVLTVYYIMNIHVTLHAAIRIL